MSRRWMWWAALAMVAVGALAVGAARDGGARTESERVDAIASEVRCPTCRGLSAAESDAKTAVAIRAEIRDRLRGGQTSGQIRAYLVSRYGDDALLRPRATGVSALVWVVPVAALVLAAAGVTAMLARGRRARTETSAALTDADRVLVEEAVSRAEREGR